MVPKQVPIKKEAAAKTASQPEKKTETVPLAQKQLEATKLENQQQIEIPPEITKEKEAIYLNYYQSVWEKIRRYAKRNYPRFIACGEVYIHVILLSDGSIKEISVDENRSCQNWLLKAIAKKSIQQAAPFGAFPGLKPRIFSRPDRISLIFNNKTSTFLSAASSFSLGKSLAANP